MLLLRLKKEHQAGEGKGVKKERKARAEKEFDSDGHSRVVQRPETQEEITNNSLQRLDDTHLRSKSLYFYCHHQHPLEIDQRLTRSKRKGSI